MKPKLHPSCRVRVVPTSNLKRPRRPLAASIGLLLASSAATFAQTLTWDPNTTLTGAQGGSGDWDGGNFWWNGTTNVAWTSGASAVFAGGIAGSVDASGIVVDDLRVSSGFSNPYTFFSSGGTLTFGGGNGVHLIDALTGGLTITASIAGTEGLSITSAASGGYTVVFSGSNTYSGITRILAGGGLTAASATAIPSTSTVQLDSATSEFRAQVTGTIGALSGLGVVNVSSGAQLSIGANDSSQTFGGTIIGSGSINKVGTGTLTLTTGHIFAGLTTITGGTLAVSGGDSVPQGVSVGAAGTLQLLANETVSTFDGSGLVDIGGNTFSVGSGTFSGAIIGTGSVVKNTTGTLTLSGANTFSGGLAISQGTLAAADFAPLGTGNIVLSGGQLSFNGASFSSNRALSLVGGGTLGVANSVTNATLDGPISGTGTLSKAGAGTLTLGNSANAFSGDVSISAGTLSVSTITDSGISGPLGSGSGISIVSGGTLRIVGASSTSTNRTFSLSGTAGIEIESAAATFELRGGLSGGFAKLGPGSLVLSGTASGSSANITISEGALIAAGGAAIPDTASLTVATGATFRLQSSETIATLSGAGGVELAGNSLSLGLIGFSAPARTFTGTISGTGSVTTVSGITQTLTGANTYSGGTNILGGTVNVPDFTSLGSGPITIGGATTFGALGVTAATASTSRPIQIGIAGANFNSGTGTSAALNGVLSGSGPVTFRGPGIWTIGNSANSFTGNPTLLGIVSVPSLTDAGVNGPLGAGNLVAIADAATAGRLKLEGVGNFSTNRSLVLGSAGATIEVSSGATMSANSVASGGGSLFKAGAGTLVLNAANTFTGSTSISAGTLAASGGNAIPDSSRVDISAGGTLQILASETIAKLSGAGNADIATGTLTVGGNGESSTFSGFVSGSGALVKTGAGTLTLSGTNTFSGGTTISSGTIAVASLAALGTGGLRIDGALSYTGPTATDGRNLEFGGVSALITSNAGSVLTLTGAATGTGGLRYNGSGTLELTNVTNSFSGDVRIAGGVLSTTSLADIGTSSALGLGTNIFLSFGILRYTGADASSNRPLTYEISTSAIEVANGVTLTMNRAQGAGGLNKIGAGTLIQTDPTNSFYGNVLISAGKLVTGTLQNSGVDSALGRGSGVTLNESELALFAGAGGTTNRQIFVGGGGVFSVNGGDVTLTSPVVGSGPLTFRGTSALVGGVTLAAATTRTGTTTIDRLKLRATSGNSLHDASRVTLTDNSGTTPSIEAAETIGSIEGGAGADAGQLILGAALTTGGDNSSTTLSAAISGNGKLIKVGGGTMTLAGANTFSGGISISSGTLAVTDVNNSAVPGPLGSGDFEIGNAAASVRLKYDGNSSRATNRRLLLTNNGARIEVSNPLASLIWSGVVSGSSLAQLIKDGPGALRLTGANSFAGLIQINAGTLQLLGGNAVPDGSTVSLAAGSALELMAGTNETIGLLQGDGDIKLGGQKLTLGGTGDSSTVNGMFSGSGGSSLEKIGGGTLTITNNLNSFSGGVFISNGAISVPTIANSGVSSPLGKTGAINLGDASHTGRLTVTGSANSATDRPVQLASGGGAIEVSAPSATLALSGSITGGGTLLKLGAGRLSIINDKTFTSTTVVGEGTLTLAGSIAGGLTVISPGIADTTGTRSTGNLSMMGGTLAPGGRGAIGAFNSTGVFVDSGILALDFNSAAPGGYDSINVTGAVELDGAIRFDINLGFDPVDYVDSFTIVVNDGIDNATVGTNTMILTDYGPHRDGEVILITSGGFSQYFEVHLGTGASNDIELLAIPEPGSTVLLLGGLAMLAARRRKD